MSRTALIALAIGAALLVGCGAAGPELATSVEEVAGTWTSTDPNNSGTFIYHADGGLTCGSTLSVAENNSNCEGMIWFEGTEMHLVDQKLCGAAEGVYEIQLLENGNIKHVLIEDDEACRARIDFLTGVDREGVEMAPVVQ